MEATDGQNVGKAAQVGSKGKIVMSRQVMIIADGAKSPASSQGSDRHDVTGHHRYDGSSVLNGGERIIETRRGPRPRAVNVCGF
jgi:hypothetical protein